LDIHIGSDIKARFFSDMFAALPPQLESLSIRREQGRFLLHAHTLVPPELRNTTLKHLVLHHVILGGDIGSAFQSFSNLNSLSYTNYCTQRTEITLVHLSLKELKIELVGSHPRPLYSIDLDDEYLFVNAEEWYALDRIRSSLVHCHTTLPRLEVLTLEGEDVEDIARTAQDCGLLRCRWSSIGSEGAT
jgi:hypothetical protein